MTDIPKPSVPSPELPPTFYDAFISNHAKFLKPSPIRHLLYHEQKPGMVSMLVGKPNPETFPFASISMTVRSPTPGIDKELTELVINDEDLVAALQYGVTSGDPELVRFLTELNLAVHGGQRNDSWRVSVGSGSQDLLFKAFTALINPGDSVLIQAPTYPGVLPIVGSLGCEVIEVLTDSEGIIPSSLSSCLESWPIGKPHPKLLYTVPFGSNPTGVSTTLSRRLEVLHLARKYSFNILEDDPYFHIYYGTCPRPASYFALERMIEGDQGRVLRFDSLSKVLSSGFRIGWITGPCRLVDMVDCHSACTTMQAPSISQIMIVKLMRLWGIKGFLAHAEQVANFYRERRDKFHLALEQHLSGLAEWTVPDAAMFFWLKLRLPPSASCENTTDETGDSEVLIRTTAIEKGILCLPGACANFDERKSCHVRLSFSLLSDQDVQVGLRRLSEILREQ
ncbi:TdiD protein [Mycena floridula]|nr:TdiD protein [Mycena floridula]